MELRTNSGQLKPSGAFKLIATGYLLGAAAVFIPAFALMILLTLASGAPIEVNGELVEGNARIAVLVPFIMVPFILAMQAVMFGGLVVFGLWLYQKWRPIRVIDKSVGPELGARAPGGNVS